MLMNILLGFTTKLLITILLLIVPLHSVTAIEFEEPTQIKVEYRLEGLSLEVTQHLFDECERFDVDPILMYKLMKLESGLDPNNVSKNYRNGEVTSLDRGLCQMNNRYEDWYAELAGLEEFDVFDPKDSISMGTAGIAQYQKYWRNRGKLGRDIDDYALSSYNRGIGGTKRKLGTGYIKMVRKQEVLFVLATEGGSDE